MLSKHLKSTISYWYMCKCISTASFSILVLSSPNPPFDNQRGIRQGDPFLPSSLVNNLSRLIEKVGRGKENWHMQSKWWHLQLSSDVCRWHSDVCQPNPKSLDASRKTLKNSKKYTDWRSTEIRAQQWAIYSKVCAKNTSLHGILGFPPKALTIMLLELMH